MFRTHPQQDRHIWRKWNTHCHDVSSHYRQFTAVTLWSLCLGFKYVCQCENHLASHTHVTENIVFYYWMVVNVIKCGIRFQILAAFYFIYWYVFFSTRAIVMCSVHLRTCMYICMIAPGDFFHVPGLPNWFSGWKGGGWHEVRAEGN